MRALLPVAAVITALCLCALAGGPIADAEASTPCPTPPSTDFMGDFYQPCTPPPTRTPVGTPQPPATFTVSPDFAAVRPGDVFEIDVSHDAAFPSGGAQTDVAFDQSVLELIDAQPGDIYHEHDALFIDGVAGPDGPPSRSGAIANANCTGALANAAVLLVPPGNDIEITGPTAFLKLTFRARAEGFTYLTLAHASMLDAASSYDSAFPTLFPGQVLVTASPEGATPRPTPTPIAPADHETLGNYACAGSSTPLPTTVVPTVAPSPAASPLNLTPVPTCEPLTPTPRATRTSGLPTGYVEDPTPPGLFPETPSATPGSATPCASLLPAPSDGSSSSTPSPVTLAAIGLAAVGFLGLTVRRVASRR